MITNLFESAQSELMKRVEYRDSHLLHCLISIAVLFALGRDIEIAGVKSAGNQDVLYGLAFPVSLLFLSLYVKEELIIGSLVEYLGDLGKRAAKRKLLNGLPHWANSKQLLDCMGPTFYMRLLTTVCAFLIFPGLLVAAVLDSRGFHFIFYCANVIAAIFVIGFLIRSHAMRLATIKRIKRELLEADSDGTEVA